MIKVFLFLSLLCTMTTEVYAWGAKGHMIVAEIAEQRLTPRARVAVRELLGGKSLAEVSTWADTIRSQAAWRFTSRWHFADLEDDQNYEDIPQGGEGNLMTAMKMMVSILRQRSATPIERRHALMFLVHFLADAHQPLHTGRPDDRGGNDVRVIFFGRSTNLHAVWDSGILGRSPLDYKSYALALQRRNPHNPIFDLKNLIPYAQIVSENLAARQQIYQFAPGMFRSVFLHERYLERNRDLVDSRLLIGGKRLALILNSLFP
jgi:hypothetical protein